MKVLAIESSAVVASVAIAEDEKLICEYTLNYKKTHSQTLMPMIEEIVDTVGIKLDTLDLIAVSSGPGSFTGLRIGSATAKGLAHTLNLPIAAVPTLDAIAYNISNTNKLICPLMDARRNQVYTALYNYENANEKITRITDYMAIPVDEMIKRIKELDQQVIFLGDGVKPNIQYIEDSFLKEDYMIAPIHNNIQRAASVAALGLTFAKEGKLINYMEHIPEYLRKSQAEREYERNIKGK